MFTLPSLRAAAIATLFLAPIITSRAWAEPGYRITVTPNPILLCPGEEATFTVVLEKRVNLGDDKSAWLRAGGVMLDMQYGNLAPDGTELWSSGRITTDNATGSFSKTIKAADKAGTQEAFLFSAELSNPTTRISAGTLVITLSAIDCDNLKNTGEKTEVDELDKQEKKILDAPDREKAGPILRDAHDRVIKLKRGKYCTNPKIMNAANELKALEKIEFRMVSPFDLTRYREARNSKARDVLAGIGKLDRLDPTKAWYENLKARSMEELETLARQTEAACDAYLKHVLQELGTPPNFANEISPAAVAISRAGGKWIARRTTDGAIPKDQTIARVVQFQPDSAILNGLDRIHKELQNRLPAADEASRKRIRDLMSDVYQANGRCQTGESLVKYHGTYRDRKAAGNDKGAEDIQKQYLDRFQKQLQKELMGR